MTARLLARFVADRFGAAIPELGLIMPFAAAIIFGGIELSRFFYQENALYAAASAAIRHASIEREIILTEVEAVFYQELTAFDNGLIQSLAVTASPHSLDALQRLQIEINYRFQPISKLVWPNILDRNMVVKGLVPVES